MRRLRGETRLGDGDGLIADELANPVEGLEGPFRRPQSLHKRIEADADYIDLGEEFPDLLSLEFDIAPAFLEHVMQCESGEDRHLRIVHLQPAINMLIEGDESG